MEDTENNPRARLSSPERRAIIQRLIEEKKRNRTYAPAAPAFQEVTNASEPVQSLPESPAVSNENVPPTSTSSPGTCTPKAPLSTPPPQSMYPTQSEPRIYDSRTERVLSELQRQWAEQCTFQPRINSISGSVRNNSVPFLDRARKWLEDKQQDALKLREDQLKAELENCSFKPQIQVRKRPSSALPVTERLYAPKKADEVLDSQRLREEQELRECTFRPRLNAKPHVSAPVQPRYLENTTARAVTPSGKRPTVAEYSFTPQTNGVRREMTTAQSYLEENAFERLARVRTVASTASSTSGQAITASLSQAADLSAMSSSLGISRARPSSAPHRRPSEMEEKRDFDEFLQRQNEREVRKQEKLNAIKSQTEHQIRGPQLCRKSLLIAKTQGSFMDRLEHQLSKREAAKSSPVQEPPPDYTFKPEILPSSRRRKSRTVDELSNGDLAKREAIKESERLKQEQRELQGTTFKPEIVSQSAQSRLRLVDEPAKYLERVREERERAKARAERALEQRARQDMAECTFKPEVHDAPAYVKRIARSMQLVRPQHPPTPTRTWV